MESGFLRRATLGISSANKKSLELGYNVQFATASSSFFFANESFERQNQTIHFKYSHDLRVLFDFLIPAQTGNFTEKIDPAQVRHQHEIQTVFDSDGVETEGQIFRGASESWAVGCQRLARAVPGFLTSERSRSPGPRSGQRSLA